MSQAGPPRYCGEVVSLRVSSGYVSLSFGGSGMKASHSHGCRAELSPECGTGRSYSLRVVSGSVLDGINPVSRTQAEGQTLL